MNIIVTASQVPFIYGGAIHHVQGTVDGLRAMGHRVELIQFPFHFQPAQALVNLMEFTESLDLSMPNGQRVDRVISLQFPGYGIQHPHHIVWLMHQHRAAYELHDPEHMNDDDARLRNSILAFDVRVLSKVTHRFAISQRVANRLEVFNKLQAEPILHPPALESFFRCSNAQPYIFCPSRLENLKRQHLLIRAIALTHSNVGVVIAGTGGQELAYRQLISELNLQHRVILLGHIPDAEKIAFYENCLAVFFGPFDEDYGYITLEAMLSGKPVITCTDSGGPLEFVVDRQTGYIVEPQVHEIAEVIDKLCSNYALAANMGRAGLAHYRDMRISWDNAIQKLISV